MFGVEFENLYHQHVETNITINTGSDVSVEY